MDKIRQDNNMGKNLRQLRLKCGLTQEQTAAKLQLEGSNTTRAIYSRYETGELNIRADDLKLLKLIFKCNYKDIFFGS